MKTMRYFAFSLLLVAASAHGMDTAHLDESKKEKTRERSDSKHKIREEFELLKTTMHNTLAAVEKSVNGLAEKHEAQNKTHANFVQTLEQRLGAIEHPTKTQKPEPALKTFEERIAHLEAMLKKEVTSETPKPTTTQEVETQIKNFETRIKNLEGLKNDLTIIGNARTAIAWLQNNKIKTAVIGTGAAVTLGLGYKYGGSVGSSALSLVHKKQ